MENIIILFVILGLIFVNGFFAAAEMALVTVKPQAIKHKAETGNKNAILLKKVTIDATRYLSTIQVAITLAGFLSSAFAGARLSSNLVALFADINIVLPNNIAVIVITIILSYITLVFGELVPKRIAMRHALAYALIAAKPVWIIMIITKPFVKLLSLSTNLVLKLFRVNPISPEEKIKERDIKEMILLGHFQGLYAKSEKEMIENIFTFDDLTAENIMTPRVHVKMIQETSTVKEVMHFVQTYGYSRIPVYGASRDHIEGVLIVKDLLIDTVDINDSIKPLLRKPYVIPKHTKINELFKSMKQTKEHLAFIIDEYGGFEGIITMEDLIEEIVGDIFDEHDQLDADIKKENSHTYLVNGHVHIQDVNRKLNLKITLLHPEYDTLSGFVIYHLGKIPQTPGDTFVDNNITYKVVKITKKRVDLIRIILPTSGE
ncbi:MAG: hemolysin family protein [Bacillota bacterium]